MGEDLGKKKELVLYEKINQIYLFYLPSWNCGTGNYVLASQFKTFGFVDHVHKFWENVIFFLTSMFIECLKKEIDSK